jgi:hypothetical protein
MSAMVRLHLFSALLAMFAVAASENATAQDKKDVIKITAEDITKELDKDSDATFKKYVGKTVEISGPVSQSQKQGAAPDWRVELQGAKRSDGKGFHIIIATFKPDTPDFKKAQKLTKGKKVVIRGEYQLSLGSTIVLKDNTIVSAP